MAWDGRVAVPVISEQGRIAVHAGGSDGNGTSDVITANYSWDEIAWHKYSTELADFALAQVVTSPGVRAPLSAEAADLDGDGDLDVISRSSDDDKIAWYENIDGLGTFGPQQVIAQDLYLSRQSVPPTWMVMAIWTCCRVYAMAHHRRVTRLFGTRTPTAWERLDRCGWSQRRHLDPRRSPQTWTATAILMCLADPSHHSPLNASSGTKTSMVRGRLGRSD